MKPYKNKLVENQGDKVCVLPVNRTATNLYIYDVNSMVCILYLYIMMVYEKIKIDNNDEINRLYLRPSIQICEKQSDFYEAYVFKVRKLLARTEKYFI